MIVIVDMVTEEGDKLKLKFLGSRGAYLIFPQAES